MSNRKGDKIIELTTGQTFKVRKNGRIRLTIDPGNENEETIRCTPIVATEDDELTEG